MTTPYQHKEIIHDLSFILGLRWAAIEVPTRRRIMDSLGGSRGMTEQILLWAEEFNCIFYEAKGEMHDQLEYLVEIEEFFELRWNVKVAEIVADRIMNG